MEAIWSQTCQVSPCDHVMHVKALVDTENCMDTRCYSSDFWHNLCRVMIFQRNVKGVTGHLGIAS